MRSTSSASESGPMVTAGATAAATDPLPWWLRLYLLLGTAQGLALGITGLLVPAEMQIPLRISPLNARVAAAMYTAAALGLLIAAFGRRADARILVWCFALATTLILGVTLVHWPDFMSPALPHRPLWLTAYVLDPLLALAIIPAAGYLRPETPPARHALTWPFAIAAVVLAVLVVTASLLHLARFKPGPATWLWFAGFAALGVVFGLALLREVLPILLGPDRPGQSILRRRVQPASADPPRPA